MMHPHVQTSPVSAVSVFEQPGHNGSSPSIDSAVINSRKRLFRNAVIATPHTAPPTRIPTVDPVESAPNSEPNHRPMAPTHRIGGNTATEITVIHCFPMAFEQISMRELYGIDRRNLTMAGSSSDIVMEESPLRFRPLIDRVDAVEGAVHCH